MSSEGGALRADAIRTLRDWVAPDAHQAELRDSFVRYLDERADGLRRDCSPSHLTASALVVSLDRTAVALTMHARLGRWVQFGGHCEPGDVTLAGVALREAAEESGVVDLRLTAPTPTQLCRFPAACRYAGADHLDVQFLIEAPRTATVVSTESIDVRWFRLDSLPDRLDSSLHALIERAGVPLGG